MYSPALTILHVNTFDRWGGAESIARSLVSASNDRGHQAYLAVGRNVANDPSMLPVAHEDGLWGRIWAGLSEHLRWLDRFAAGDDDRRKSGIRTLVERIGQPGRIVDELRGIESFRFPGTYRLLELSPRPPDIIHAHNLHGGYFDLRALPWLSQRVPVVLTLHDSWLTTGHCSQPFACERWRTGCGQCPDLTIYPSIHRDSTASNWARKQAIYEQAHVFVATPSEWLLDRVRQSILGPAIVDARVIPNGVDLAVFRPGDKKASRRELGIPHASSVLLFVASGISTNPFKAYDVLRSAVAMAAERLSGANVLLIALGESRPTETVGRAKIWFVPFEADQGRVARYYQAADLHIHAAHAETFPTAVIEAQACGVPVVATATGGTSEQIRCLGGGRPASEATGVLVEKGDADAMATAIVALLGDSLLLRELSRNAVQHAKESFDRERQIEAYLDWYKQILAPDSTPPQGTGFETGSGSWRG